MKKLVTAIALGLLAHCSPGFSSYDLQSEAGRSSFAHRYLFANTPKMGAAEEKWWGEFEASKSKNIVQYVHNLSKSNPEAATWFLLTGGRDGFASRQATAEEEKLLLGAMKEVSHNWCNSTSYKKSQEWSQSSQIGQQHFGILMQQMMQMQVKMNHDIYNLHQGNLLLTEEVTQLRSEVRETKVVVQNVVKEVKASFADQLREMTEKAEKERQEIISTLAREREARDRQREDDYEKRLEAVDKNYVRLSRFYTPEGLQKSQQHKKAMEDFRDYYKDLIEVLNRELKHTRSDLNGLIGYEMASDLPTIQRGLKVATDKMPWKIVTLVGLSLDSNRFKHYDEALENLRKKLYDVDLPENEARYHKQREAIEKEYNQNWLGKSKLPGWYDAYKATEDKKSKNYLDYEGTKKALYSTYFIEQERLKAEKDKAPEAERPVLIEQSIDQYGSVRKANQERLKAKYAEWQTKRSTLEALGIETSFEIIQTVNNAFAGLLTTADMRDGLIETLEKRAESLEKTAAHEARGKEILKAHKMKELQVKARLYNKNFRKGMINDALNQFVSIALKEGHTPEGIESALITHITA